MRIIPWSVLMLQRVPDGHLLHLSGLCNMMLPLQDEWQANLKSFSARVTAAVNAGAVSDSTKYTLFQETGLAGLRLFVFVRRDLLPLVGNAHQAVIATGVAGVMANKGAVAISCQVMGTHLGFVNSHLAADNDESALLDRNKMYRVCLHCTAGAE
jgi:hypothetical protein